MVVTKSKLALAFPCVKSLINDFLHKATLSNLFSLSCQSSFFHSSPFIFMNFQRVHGLYMVLYEFILKPHKILRSHFVDFLAYIIYCFQNMPLNKKQLYATGFLASKTRKKRRPSYGRNRLWCILKPIFFCSGHISPIFTLG